MIQISCDHLTFANQNAVLWTTIFEAHLSVLRLKEPPPSVIGWTVTALEHIYNACSEESTVSTPAYQAKFLAVKLNLVLFLPQDHVCLRLLARCLALIPVEKLERIVRDSQVGPRQKTSPKLGYFKVLHVTLFQSVQSSGLFLFGIC